MSLSPQDPRILYIEDNADTIRVVQKALHHEGWQHVENLNTSHLAAVHAGLRQISLWDDPVICIVDGHNPVRFGAPNDPNAVLVDLTPPFLVQWLWDVGLPPGSRLILFSNDEFMVSQAQSGALPGFAAAIAKNQGGLPELLSAVRREATILAQQRRR